MFGSCQQKRMSQGGKNEKKKRKKNSNNLLANETDGLKGSTLQVGVPGVVGHIVEQNGDQVIPLAMGKVKGSHGGNHLSKNITRKKMAKKGGVSTEETRI